MTKRALVTLSAAAAALLAALPATAQYAYAARTGTTPAPPRSADGHPDFSGIWTNITITPLERPASLANKEFFTEQEAVAYEKQMVSQRNRDKRDRGTERDVASAYNDFWWDSGTKVLKSRRTSIIVDPPDGRIPALTPERKHALEAQAAAVKAFCDKPGSGCQPENGGRLGPADSAAERPLMERCLSFGTAGPPMMPSAYNNNYQFVQSPGMLAIDVEMAHDVRRIAFDGSNHMPSGVHQWLGDSRGHWEGDTLVVETTNFTDKTSFHGSDKNLKVVERFTLTDPETLVYRFTIDDPTAFTKPWTGEIPLQRAPGPLFEYACHEGNVGMRGILSSARADEKAYAESHQK
jgi:hypothetical protein